MKRLFISSLVMLVGIVVIFASIPGAKMKSANDSSAFTKPDVKSSTLVKRDPGFGKIPLYFIPNHGQVDEKVKFYAKTPAYTLWMTKEGLVFDSVKKVEVKTEVEEGHPSQERHTPPFGHPSQEGSNGVERDVSRLIFPGANKNHEMVSVDLSQHQVNYLKGNDPSKWQIGIRTSKAVFFKDIYKNIDLKVYGIEKQVEYDWIVKSGADPKVISIKYERVSSTRIDREGNLVVETKFGKLLHKKPASYQVIDGKRIAVQSTFKKVGKNTYGFKVEKYNRYFELIIDPMVCPIYYSTYLGGTNNDEGFGIAVDSDGYSYVTGRTNSTDFPIENSYQGMPGGDYDAFVTKLSPTDGCPVYSTYLGGSEGDYGYGIAVDSNGSAYVTGYTISTNFPTKNPYQGTLNGLNDVFVTKLAPGGNTLLYSTYLGGSSYDIGCGIAVDSNGSAYVTGFTDSTNFPTHNACQNSLAGPRDAFVARLCSYDRLPVLVVNKTLLNFAVNSSGITTGPQSFLIRNIGGGTMNWTVTDDADWLDCDPENGVNFGVVTVSVNAPGLSPRTYTGTITIADPNAINSPQTIAATLTVYDTGGGLPVQPFGFFETPVNGAEVKSSVPVTGWALDDIEVVSVKLYREAGSNLIYIGDALFVEGARPDVAQAYPQYPNCSRAGWGYMMLNNVLPDGSYVLHAIAADKEGNNVTLGTKAITINNATAVKPFGALDIPAPGGMASGSNYRVIGWALTPPPNKIPSNGVHLFIDGVDLGEATYDIFRQDVYDLFPGYENRSGALAYYDFNTTGYNNGMHTIQFAAADNAGNTDGIGSRYFNIYNLGSINSLSHASNKEQYSKAGIADIAVDYPGPVKMIKGNKTDIVPKILYPGEIGNIDIEIKEVERIEIHLSDRGANFTYTGYLEVGEQLWPLPIGSTLDTERGIFYWSPGPGFIGLYRLVFIGKGPDREMNKRIIDVNIVPKFKSKRS